MEYSSIILQTESESCDEFDILRDGDVERGRGSCSLPSIFVLIYILAVRPLCCTPCLSTGDEPLEFQLASAVTCF